MTALALFKVITKDFPLHLLSTLDMTYNSTVLFGANRGLTAPVRLTQCPFFDPHPRPLTDTDTLRRRLAKASLAPHPLDRRLGCAIVVPMPPKGFSGPRIEACPNRAVPPLELYKKSTQGERPC
jgi:hypothetical protein